MQTDFWLERWRNQQIGFHQARVNAHLETYWPDLSIPVGDPVFVPLCGKSLDMLWLASQGHRVIGVELSPIAAESFFVENGLSPTVHRKGPFEVYRTDEIEIRCGDFFDLTSGDLSEVRAVYDRASLVALPEEMRQRYAAHMAELLAVDAQVMLITFEYPQGQMAGPPFSVGAGEVHRLYDEAFDVSVLATLDVLAQNERFRLAGVTRMEEHVFRMCRRMA